MCYCDQLNFYVLVSETIGWSNITLSSFLYDFIVFSFWQNYDRIDSCLVDFKYK